jgi:hypothetical protein
MLRCVNEELSRHEELFDDVPFGVGQITIPFEEHPYFAALPSADVLFFSASKSKFLLCKRARIFLLFSDSERVFSFY